MTDRLNGVTVTFDRDLREDDAEAILSAIRQIRGVAHVEPHIVTADDHFAYRRAAAEFKGKLHEFLDSLK